MDGMEKGGEDHPELMALGESSLSCMGTGGAVHNSGGLSIDMHLGLAFNGVVRILALARSRGFGTLWDTKKCSGMAQYYNFIIALRF